MKPFSSFLRIVLLISMLTLPFGLTVDAAPAPPPEMLRQAYVSLSVADHDYKGHRVKAMKEIQAACKLLGYKLHGEGRGHEKQIVSDVQLRNAQELLEQARHGLRGKPLKHVNAAIKQITIALAIR
jgi:hypothetical protein